MVKVKSYIDAQARMIEAQRNSLHANEKLIENLREQNKILRSLVRDLETKLISQNSSYKRILEV